MAEAVSRTIPAEPSEATVAVIDNFEMFDQLGMTHGGKVSQVLMRGGLMSSDILQVQAESTTQATRSILAASVKERFFFKRFFLTFFLTFLKKNVFLEKYFFYKNVRLSNAPLAPFSLHL